MRSLQQATAPIILGNAPSSGSTLLRVLLGRHPAICTGNELAILDKPTMLDEAAESYRDRIDSWICDGYPAEYVGASWLIFEQLSEYGWDRSELGDLAKACNSIPELVTRFYARPLAAGGAQRWLEKTPSNVYSFERIAKMFPNAKLVHIIRDARDAIPSYCARSPSVFKAISRWYYATLTGIQYRGRPDYCELRYEDLVIDPATELKRLCSFFGEPFVPELLQPKQPGVPVHTPGGWRCDPAGAVIGDGNERRRLTLMQASLFQHVRLSEYGARLLPAFGRYRHLTSPLALQQHLGYGVESLVDLDDNASDRAELTREALLQQWDDFLKHRKHAWNRYQRRLQCQTRICMKHD